MKRATTALTYDQTNVTLEARKNPAYASLLQDGELPLKYHHRLSLYKEVPMGDIHLEDLERLAIARLQCTNIVPSFFSNY